MTNNINYGIKIHNHIRIELHATEDMHLLRKYVIHISYGMEFVLFCFFFVQFTVVSMVCYVIIIVYRRLYLFRIALARVKWIGPHSLFHPFFFLAHRWASIF